MAAAKSRRVRTASDRLSAVPPVVDGEFSYHGLRLSYEVHGSGPQVLVYLHGLLLDGNLNRPLATALAEAGNRVVLLDLPGHGHVGQATSRVDAPDGLLRRLRRRAARPHGSCHRRHRRGVARCERRSAVRCAGTVSRPGPSPRDAGARMGGSGSGPRIPSASHRVSTTRRGSSVFSANCRGACLERRAG